jgi:hypothetical protein
MRRWLGMTDAEAGEPAADPQHLLLLRGTPHLALAMDRVLGRFDMTGDESTLALDGRLVAIFDAQAFRSRFGFTGTEPRL